MWMLVDKIKRGSCSFRVQRSGHICYLKMWLKLNLCGQLSGGYFAGDGDRGLYSVCGLFTWQERQVRDLGKKRGRVQWRGRRTIWDEWWTRIYCMLSGRGGNEIMLSLAAVTQLKSGRAVFSLEASDTVCSYIKKNWNRQKATRKRSFWWRIEFSVNWLYKIDQRRMCHRFAVLHCESR